MVRALPVLLLLLSAACGLAEDERDEKNRYIYLTFYDKAFEAYCLGEFDVDGDGRISRYEAQRVRTVECPERGVASLSDLKEFTRLERLDCRGNALTRLDVTMTRLEWLDCSDNGLVSLDVNGLRGLAYLDCGGNSLPRLDLQSNASLATLLCPDNALAGALDVTSCVPTCAATLPLPRSTASPRKASTSTDRRNSSASDFRHATARRAVAGISIPGGTAPLPSALFPHLRQKTVRKGRFFFIIC